MSGSLRERLDGVHPKSLGMRGESLLKKVGAELAKPDMLARAMAVTRMSPKDIARELGLADQSSISKWLSGAENVTFEHLWKAPGLRAGLVVALAESTGLFRIKHTLELDEAAS